MTEVAILFSKMYRPFADQDDPDLVAAAQRGDKEALAEIVSRHRPWIYNIAVRMLGDPGTAEDTTQEIFIKALRGLDSFEGRSSFRTWLYRVAFHQILNSKRTRSEEAVGDFEYYAAGLEAAPNLSLDIIPEPEREVLVEEAKTACMTGMLLCLNREQRLAYVLGAVFEMSDTMAAEILEIPPATFRKRLQRARADLHNFMNGNCGLINKNNSCRCARKTRTFFEAGHLDRHELKFQRDRVASIGEVAPQQAEVVADTLSNHYPTLYREHAFSDPRQLAERLSELLEDTTLGALVPQADE